MSRVGNKFALSGRLGINAVGFTRGLKRAGQTYDSFQRNIKDKNHIIGRSFKNLNSKMNTGFRRAAFVGLGSLTLGLGIAAREFVNFDQAIVNATAKITGLEAGTKQYSDTMDILRKKAREVGAQTQFTATQAAQGLNQFVKMGFNAEEAMGALASNVNLATVAEEEFNETSRISAKLLGAMGLNSRNSEQKIKNLTALQRGLGLAVNMSSVTLVDMFEALKTSAPIATKLGASMNQLISVTAALGSSGIDATLASTAMRNIFNRMLNPTDSIAKRLDQLNLSKEAFLDAKGGLDIVKIMDKVGKATKKLSIVERGAVFFDLFGLRAVAGAANLSENLAGVQEIMDALESKKTLLDIAEEMRKGIKMQLQILGSTALEKAFQFFDAFTANGKEGIKNLTEAIRQMDVKPMVEFAKTTMEFLKFLGNNWKTLLAVAGAIKIVSIAIGIAEIATAAFGVTLGLTPIGAAIIAMGLLSAAIVLLIGNYDELNEAASHAGKMVTQQGYSKTSNQIPFSAPYGGGFNPFTYQQPVASAEPQVYNGAYKDSVTPKPMTYSKYTLRESSLDINFNGMPQGTDISQSRNFADSGIKINPVLQP